MLTIYLVRHGQTEYNVQGIVQGQLNTPLNATGHLQGELLAKRLQEEVVRFDIAFSADLDRASETALAILRKQGGAVTLQLERGLRERCLGDLEGTKGPIQPPYPPNYESTEALRRRCLDWWTDRVVPLASEPGDRTVLVSSHSGYLRVLFECLTAEKRDGGLAYKIQGHALQRYPVRRLKNTCITVIKVDDEGNGFMERYNDDAHLMAGMGGDAGADGVV